MNFFKITFILFLLSIIILFNHNSLFSHEINQENLECLRKQKAEVLLMTDKVLLSRLKNIRKFQSIKNPQPASMNFSLLIKTLSRLKKNLKNLEKLYLKAKDFVNKEYPATTRRCIEHYDKQANLFEKMSSNLSRYRNFAMVNLNVKINNPPVGQTHNLYFNYQRKLRNKEKLKLFIYDLYLKNNLNNILKNYEIVDTFTGINVSCVSHLRDSVIRNKILTSYQRSIKNIQMINKIINGDVSAKKIISMNRSFTDKLLKESSLSYQITKKVAEEALFFVVLTPLLSAARKLTLLKKIILMGVPAGIVGGYLGYSADATEEIGLENVHPDNPVVNKLLESYILDFDKLKSEKLLELSLMLLKDFTRKLVNIRTEIKHICKGCSQSELERMSKKLKRNISEVRQILAEKKLSPEFQNKENNLIMEGGKKNIF